MKIITDQNLNYPFAVLVWVIAFLFFYFLCWGVDLTGRFWSFVCLIVGALVAFGDTNRVPILSESLLLVNGQEVKDEYGNSVWVSPGFYFTFWIFSFAEGEHQDMEVRDVIVPAFSCQCLNKGITVEANGDWEISEHRHDNFKKQKADKMEANLISLIKRTLIRICGIRNYEKEILNNNLGDAVLTDPFFQRECQKYGIEFENMIVDVVPSDLKQEQLNSYARELFKEEKKKYPVGYTLTKEDIKEINEAIQVRLGQAKKVITNSPVVGRFDIEK